jgi:hypothetical protein
LDREDLSAFSLQPQELDDKNPKGKRVLRQMLEKAGRETDFSLSGEKVYIQLYPKKDGGCELFVIRLSSEETQDGYLFSSLDDLVDARRRLSLPRGCAFYHLPKQDNYLALVPSSEAPLALAEYGEKLKKAPSRLYLNTRCKAIWKEKEQRI